MKRLLILLILAISYTSSVYADYNDGLTAYERGDYETAYKEWLPIAELGDSEAQYHIGIIYFSGFGVTKDEGRALNWFKKSAKQGHGASQSTLGWIYHYGEGVLKDYKKAMYWYHKASTQGYSGATSRIAILHFFGKGVNESRINAAKWMEEAAEQGSVVAQFRIGLMYAKGDGVAQSYEKAKKWLHLAYDNASDYDRQTVRAKSTLKEDIESAWDSLEDGLYYGSKTPVRIDYSSGRWW